MKTDIEYTEPQCLFSIFQHRQLKTTEDGKKYYCCDASYDGKFHVPCPRFKMKDPGDGQSPMMTWDYKIQKRSEGYTYPAPSWHIKNQVPLKTWEIIEALVETARENPETTATVAIGIAIDKITKLADRRVNNMTITKESENDESKEANVSAEKNPGTE